MNLDRLMDLPEEEAGRLMELARNRLSQNRGRIGASILEVLEMELPVDADASDFERMVRGFAAVAIAESYEDES